MHKWWGIMAYRKFFYGDRILITGEKYKPHLSHEGRVTGTLIKSQRVTYKVACDCGKSIKPKAFHMDLVTTPHREADPLSIHGARMEHFLRVAGKEPERPELSQQIDDLLGCLKEKYKFVLISRYGLDGLGARTFREIGEELNLSRERIRQIESMAMRKLHAN